MRLSVLILLLSQALTSQSCTNKENTDGGQSWLNVRYIECLKNSLPCDCQKITETYYSLVLDTNPQSKTFGVALMNFELMEPSMYPIKKIASDEYAVLKSREDASTWAKLIIKDNELHFTENNTLSKFTKSKANGYDLQHEVLDNVALLNKSFTARGYSKLEEIVNEDSLRCDCNKWMGKVDMLYVKGAPKSWIMSLKNDSLTIQKITNVDRDPDDPVQTVKVASYKWK